MIYLIDTIGTETGMHLYDQSFQQTIGDKGMSVTVLSNYKSKDDASVIRLFPNFYHGGKFVMGLLFAWSLLKMWLFYIGHHKEDDIYVYQSFGLRRIDQFFIRCLCDCPQLFVIVHDIFEITGQTADARKADKMQFYNHHIPHAICHSRVTEKELIKLGYKGKTCYFPHFSYAFSKEIDEKRVAPEIRDAVDTEKKIFLFFGQIRETKGISILQEAIDHLAVKHPDFADCAEIIIAGMDKGNLISQRDEPMFVKRFLRYIDDSELNYLFSKRPFVLLPYTEICQSGVLEVVIYFRSPAIMSDIPFFLSIRDEYPSFGQIFEPLSAEALANKLYEIASDDSVSTDRYFTTEDLLKYDQSHDPSSLVDFLQGATT